MLIDLCDESFRCTKFITVPVLYVFGFYPNWADILLNLIFLDHSYGLVDTWLECELAFFIIHLAWL